MDTFYNVNNSGNQGDVLKNAVISSLDGFLGDGVCCSQHLFLSIVFTLHGSLLHFLFFKTKKGDFHPYPFGQDSPLLYAS